MQFRVPQNIDLEDKIVGPLTLVQFSELVVSGMVFYLALRSGSTLFFVAVGIPVLLLGLALAFVKIQDQPFSTFLLALGQFMLRPKLRVWRKDAALERLAVPVTVDPVHHAEVLAAAEARRERREQTVGQLDELAQLLDTRGEAAVEAAGGATAKVLEEKIPMKPQQIVVQSAQKLENRN